MSQNIGVIGSGDVGKTLTLGFAKHGYPVMIGSRTPSKLSEWSLQNKIKTGTFEEAAKFGEIIVLAVHGSQAESALDPIASSLSGKTVIDVTNPIDDTRPPENGVLHFFTNLDESLMERLQKKYPNANFVKAFNSIGNAFMVNPPFEHTPSMFICGNNEAAKEEVAKIVQLFGFIPEDMGQMQSARAIEPLCILWCIPGFLRNEWGHGFRVERTK